MNRRLTTIILVALFAATAASYLVYSLVKARTATPAAPTSTRIVVAAKDLQVGTLVQDSDLTLANWSGTLPKGYSLSTKDFVNRGVVAPIYQGEPVSTSRLAAVGAGAGLAATIPQGMRAFAVKVNDVVGVAGFVLPGMKVDILIDLKETGGSAKVRTILQNVTVLSAGQNYHQEAEGKPIDVQVVNLLVTPEQAELLSLASNETRIQLVLRNPLDSDVAKTSGSDMADLQGEPKSKPAPVAVKTGAPRKPVPVVKIEAPPAAPAPPPPPPPLKIQVLNGPKHTESSFTKPEENR